MNNYMNTFNNFNYKTNKMPINTTDNYINCNYNQNQKPVQLYDEYEGFIKGNMFKELYNEYKIKPYDVKPMNKQAELLTYVDMYSFAAHDINLYLDTHPDDNQMIDLYNRLSMQAKQASLEYQQEFGPLKVSDNEYYPWSWNKSPWPWEGSGD